MKIKYNRDKIGYFKIESGGFFTRAIGAKQKLLIYDNISKIDDNKFYILNDKNMCYKDKKINKYNYRLNNYYD